MIFVAPEDIKAAAPSAYVYRVNEERETPKGMSIAASGEGTSETTVVLTHSREGAELTISLPPQKWTPAFEKQFLQLAELSALDMISPEQAAKLSRLQVSRRNLKHPRSGEEVLREYQEKQVTQKLLAALHEYVRFYTPKNNPWSSAKENVHAE